MPTLINVLSQRARVSCPQCHVEIIEFGRYESALSHVTNWVTSCSELSRTLRKERSYGHWVFYYAHVVKSIPWTVIDCWPRNEHIDVYIYIYILSSFSNGVGIVVSYCPFLSILLSLLFLLLLFILHIRAVTSTKKTSWLIWSGLCDHPSNPIRAKVECCWLWPFWLPGHRVFSH